MLRSGTCGPIPEQVVVLDDRTSEMVMAQCSGSVMASATNCAVTLDLTCPGNPGYSATERGVVNWTEDASMGAGIVQFLGMRGTSAECTGTYDVSYAKL